MLRWWEEGWVINDLLFQRFRPLFYCPSIDIRWRLFNYFSMLRRASSHFEIEITNCLNGSLSGSLLSRVRDFWEGVQRGGKFFLHSKRRMMKYKKNMDLKVESHNTMLLDERWWNMSKRYFWQRHISSRWLDTVSTSHGVRSTAPQNICYSKSFKKLAVERRKLF